MEILNNRIESIYQALDIAYSGGAGMSSASKGNERELVVDTLLHNVFPPHYRFSSGDIIDSYGNQTGQVDVVLEQPRSYSFPLLTGGPRLYLAESVATVIEVKSNLSSQWNEVLSTSEKVAKIKRKFSSESYKEMLDGINNGSITTPPESTELIVNTLEQQKNMGSNIGEKRITFYVIGFSGWEKNETISSKLVTNQIDGILQIDKRVFCHETTVNSTQHGHTQHRSLLKLLELLQLSFRTIPDRFESTHMY